METVSGHAFISYVREDSHHADRLQRILNAAGVPVWRDTADLWPGQDWRAMIREAITKNALAFIACFSSQSVSREKSYQYDELLLAVEQLRQRRPNIPWLIPVRFDACEIPDYDIGGGRTLALIQRVDLFGDNREAGIARLLVVILNVLRQPPFDQHVRDETRDKINNRLDLYSEVPSTRNVGRTLREAIGSVEQKATPEKETSDGIIINEPVVLQGQRSKVLEVNIAPGRYRLNWTAQGADYFGIRDETSATGRGKVLASANTRETNSGEKVVRVDESGIQILAVDADTLTWKITFTPL